MIYGQILEFQFPTVKSASQLQLLEPLFPDLSEQ